MKKIIALLLAVMMLLSFTMFSCKEKEEETEEETTEEVTSKEDATVAVTGDKEKEPVATTGEKEEKPVETTGVEEITTAEVTGSEEITTAEVTGSEEEPAVTTESVVDTTVAVTEEEPVVEPVDLAAEDYLRNAFSIAFEEAYASPWASSENVSMTVSVKDIFDLLNKLDVLPEDFDQSAIPEISDISLTTAADGEDMVAVYGLSAKINGNEADASLYMSFEDMAFAIVSNLVDDVYGITMDEIVAMGGDTMTAEFPIADMQLLAELIEKYIGVIGDLLLEHGEVTVELEKDVAVVSFNFDSMALYDALVDLVEEVLDDEEAVALIEKYSGSDIDVLKQDFEESKEESKADFEDVDFAIDGSFTVDKKTFAVYAMDVEITAEGETVTVTGESDGESTSVTVSNSDINVEIEETVDGSDYNFTLAVDYVEYIGEYDEEGEYIETEYPVGFEVGLDADGEKFDLDVTITSVAYEEVAEDYTYVHSYTGEEVTETYYYDEAVGTEDTSFTISGKYTLTDTKLVINPQTFKMDVFKIDVSSAGIEIEYDVDAKAVKMPKATKSVFAVSEDEINEIAMSIIEQLGIDPAMFDAGEGEEEVAFEDEYYYYDDEYYEETVADDDYYFDMPETTVAYEYYEEVTVTTAVAQ